MFKVILFLALAGVAIYTANYVKNATSLDPRSSAKYNCAQWDQCLPGQPDNPQERPCTATSGERGVQRRYCKTYKNYQKTGCTVFRWGGWTTCAH